MKGTVLYGPRDIRSEDREDPKIEKGERCGDPHGLLPAFPRICFRAEGHAQRKNSAPPITRLYARFSIFTAWWRPVRTAHSPVWPAIPFMSCSQTARQHDSFS